MRGKIYLSLLWLLSILLSAPGAWGQDTPHPEKVAVTGRITDRDGQPLAGSTVAVKGSGGTQAVANREGYYKLDVPAGATLVFSYIGHESREVTVGPNTRVDITLNAQAVAVDDVVVIAYGTTTKATMTGALSTIGNSELVKAPVGSVTNVLAGALPGVASVQSSGQPGNDAAAIYIRGAGTMTNAASRPLVLVDGVERDFSQIDANEIESISVLKDASSTAVFGVRGANGVVLVTTRRGSEGKPVITFKSTVGLQQPISLVSQTGSYEFARFWNMKQQADNITDQNLYFTREQVEAYRTGSDPIMYPNMDWGDYIFRKTFLQSQNNLTVSGGSENVKYFVSLGYFYQNGVLKRFQEQPYDNNYNYNRYNYRANLDMKLTRTTNMRLGIGGYVGQVQEPRPLENISNAWVYAQVWTLPFAGPGFVNGIRTVVPKAMLPVPESPRDGISTFFGRGYNKRNNTQLNMDLEVSQKLDFLTPGLSVAVKGAYDNNFSFIKQFQGTGMEFQTAQYVSFNKYGNTKPQTDPDYDKTIIYVPATQMDGPLVYSAGATGRDRNWYLEGRVNYDRSFGKHRVGLLALYNQSRDYYPVNSSGSALSYQYIPRGYIGFVGRATYNYAQKYLFDFSMGYNGSENFAPGSTRYGLFPSLSAGWVISSEPFMQNQKVLDHLKLRVSWGKVGNDKGDQSRFMYMPGIWGGGGTYSFGTNNPTSAEGATFGTPGNPEVTWETAQKYNLGIETAFFKSRLTLQGDFFIEQRRDILLTPQSVPQIIATSMPNMNIGQIDNRGYEIVAGWKDRIGKVDYFINANASLARNKIIYMDEIPNKYPYMNQTGGSTGRQSNIYKFLRLYQYSDFTDDGSGNLTLNPSLPQPSINVYPGDAMYADMNGDNLINDDDKFTTGYSERPEYVFGLSAGVHWKGFDFSMQWTGAMHADKLMQIEYRIPFTNSSGRGLLQYFYDDCWTPENQLNAKYPRAAETSESWNSENSTLWLVDASYLRLKTLSVGYTWRESRHLRKIGISSLGLSLSGYNLLTFSPLKFIDPEGSTSNTGLYPLVKVYSLDINLKF